MVNNQLFRKTPPREICLKILAAFGLKDFTDTRNFSRKDLEVIKCLEKINDLKDDLQEYYIPCKARTYLNDLNTKNSIIQGFIKFYSRTDQNSVPNRFKNTIYNQKS